MAQLEQLTRGTVVKGILPDTLVTVVDVEWHGDTAITLTYRDAAGRLGNEILYRDREPTIEVATAGLPWSFDGDGTLLRLVSEAYRIHLAYLFDPLLAVHTSLVEPLPHQITAVYGEMLTRQPLRFLLADDPGAGKTIMTGLFIKELLIRGDLHRCLIVCPGSLVEQWQDELNRRFHLPFEIITNDRLEAARSGNAFAEINLAICRLDKLNRDSDTQAKLEQADWDLIVVDEAHKMSASFFGGEVKYTRRYRLGQLLSKITRHFLLLTATPHNGKEADFQLFMALLDGDRFEGRFRDGVHLRELVLQAIRYGDQPEVKARLDQAVDNALDRERLRELLEERALARDTMDASQVRAIREDMERAEARRLQPHFIADFFLAAFKLLGGSVREREHGRYEITHVPAVIRNRDRQIGAGESVLPRYERITFEKALISVPGKPLAAFLCPGHPLLDATIDLVLERYRDLLKRGAVLVNPTDPGEEPRVLVYLEHAIQDARIDRAGHRCVVSRQMQFVELDTAGKAHMAGYAPYLDYRPLKEDEQTLVESVLRGLTLREQIEQQALNFAITTQVPQHLAEVKMRKEELIRKTMAAVKDRLTKEINYWDHRAAQLRRQEEAGKTFSLNSTKARQRADELQTRLQRRMEELEQERQISALPPVVTGGVLVIPAGLLAKLRGEPDDLLVALARETRRIELAAMEAVMAHELASGFVPRDVSAEKCGYDIESQVPDTGKLRFIEVKGRSVGAGTVTVTKNEILTALNKPDEFILAVVEVEPGDMVNTPLYISRPFTREPDFGVTSVTYSLRELLARAAAVA